MQNNKENTLPIFKYSIDNPIEHNYAQYNLLNTNTYIYNNLIGDYVILIAPEYVYMYTLHNFEEPVCYVTVDSIYQFITLLYLHILLRYQYMVDITAIDYYERKFRFQLNYSLISMYANSRIRIKASLSEICKVSSITSIFQGANWYEREIWDFFGILFNNNTDLRRLLTDYAFEGFPLKKDFPLSGFVEIRYNEIVKRLAYVAIKSIQEFRIFELQNPWEYMLQNKFPDLFDLYKDKKNIPIYMEYLFNK